MTDTQPTEMPVDGPQSDTDESSPNDLGTDLGENADNDSDPQITELRKEAAANRVKAKEATQRGDHLAELLLTRSIEQATDGVLIDPTDLPRDGDYFAEDGTPDLLKIRAAAEELAAAKPHLSRPRGDVGLGVKPVEQPQSFGELMRAAMR